MCFHEHEPEVSLGLLSDFANPSSFGTILQWAGNSARFLGFCFVWICIFHFLRSPDSMGRVEGKVRFICSGDVGHSRPPSACCMRCAERGWWLASSWCDFISCAAVGPGLRAVVTFQPLNNS